MMPRRTLLGLSAAGMLAAPLGTARADLVLNPSLITLPVGTLGVVNTVLTIMTRAPNTTEFGCIGFGTNVLGSAMVLLPVGANANPATGGTASCTGGALDVVTSSSQLLTVGQTGVTSAANFGVFLNAQEPGPPGSIANQITLGTVGLTIFSPTGQVLFQTIDAINRTLLETATGGGNAGYLLTLCSTSCPGGVNQQALANAALSNPLNIIGFTANLGNSAGDPETFFVVNTSPAQVIPEPATYALLATGLAGLGVVARVRRRNA
jgi:hypothetical protein